ncbi:MAG: hypothetical protein ABIK92_03930 [Pseudomonadota bacterium]
MSNIYLKVFIKSFIISIIAVLPWYLLIRFVLEWELNVEAFSILLFILLYFPLVLISAWKIKSSKVKEREEQINKLYIGYGKGFALIVSFQFLVVILLLLVVFCK